MIKLSTYVHWISDQKTVTDRILVILARILLLNWGDDWPMWSTGVLLPSSQQHRPSKNWSREAKQSGCPSRLSAQIKNNFFFLFCWYFCIFFCLCRPSEANLQLSCQLCWLPNKEWHVPAGWRDAGFEPGLKVSQSGALPLSHHIP